MFLSKPGERVRPALAAVLPAEKGGFVCLVDTGAYKSNAKGSAKTNGGGVAHFDLKSPEDLDPSSVAGKESKTFFFCTYDAEDVRNGIAIVTIKSGENKTAKIEIEKLK